MYVDLTATNITAIRYKRFLALVSLTNDSNYVPSSFSFVYFDSHEMPETLSMAESITDNCLTSH